jgi:hypothetical protein
MLSQPIPTAPGPNWFQKSSGTTATCSTSNTVRPWPSGVSRTSTSLKSGSGPYSQVTRSRSGSTHSRISPPAWPSS